MAENLNSSCDEDVLTEKMARSENPVIRGILAENKALDRQALEQLSRDEDENIAATAAETLERLLEEEGGEEEKELENGEDDEAGVVRRIKPLRNPGAAFP